MSDYETLNMTFPEPKITGGFKVFSLMTCKECKNSATMTTNDGNRTQICMGCKRVLLKDGKESA